MTRNVKARYSWTFDICVCVGALGEKFIIPVLEHLIYLQRRGRGGESGISAEMDI